MSSGSRFIKVDTLSKIAQAIRTYITRDDNKIAVNQMASKIEQNFNRDLKMIVEAEAPFDITAFQIDGADYISTGAFSHWHWLKSLEIPDSVGKIEGSSCSDAENLITVKIGNGVKSIGNSAFNACKNLENVTIGENVESIGAWAFEQCKKLKSINIPPNVTSIGESIFEGCTNLSDVNKQGWKINTIPMKAFYNCSSLTDSSLNAMIFNNCENIEEHAFDGCDSIEEVSVTHLLSVGDYAFARCKGLKNVSIKLKPELGIGIFSGCTSLERADMWGTEIPDETFYNCSNLKVLNAFDDLEKIGKKAFYKCFQDDSIFLPKVTDIESEAFQETGAVTIVLGEKGGLINQIGHHAFCGCEKTELIYIDADVKNIGVAAFQGCTNLKEINFEYATFVPTLYYMEYEGLETIPYTCEEINVPDYLYEEWIQSYGWSFYADKIRAIKTSTSEEG